MERNDLPKTWIETNLGEIAEWGSGGTPKATDPSYYGGKIPWLVIGDLNDDYVTKSEKTISELGLQNSSAKKVQIGSVLVAMYGSIGKLGITKIECTTNQAIAFTQKIYGGISNKFIFYYLFSQKKNLLDIGKGGTQANISQTVLKGYRIPLPPLAEQQRIVAKIDALLSRVNSCKSRLDKIPALLKNFRQSVLAAAVSGGLTKGWSKENSGYKSAGEQLKEIDLKRREVYEKRLERSKKLKLSRPYKPNYIDYSIDKDTYVDAELPDGWIVARVGLLCDCIVPGRDKPRSFTGSIPWVTLPDITSDEIGSSHGQLKLSDKEIKEVNARLIPRDSVIMSCIGRFGVSAYVKDPVVINQQLHAFLESEAIDPKYLMYHVRRLESYQKSIATSTTIAYLNKRNCNSLPINLPTIEEQSEIVRRVEELFHYADSIEARYEKAKAWFDKVPQAILAKAFRGELVPQDAYDEPASVLLEKIRLQKQTTKAKPKSKPTRHKAAL